MSVKWHGQRSVPRKVNGGGPQGATLGILEYLSQSNNCADLVNEEDRFRFVDDLSVLEIVNLLTVGLTSYNLKHRIPADIPLHNQYIPADNLQSQDWLTKINEWTLNQKMMINEQKTKNIESFGIGWSKCKMLCGSCTRKYKKGSQHYFGQGH